MDGKKEMHGMKELNGKMEATRSPSQQTSSHSKVMKLMLEIFVL